jgi:uncharacterized protein with FMN-binding domain
VKRVAAALGLTVIGLYLVLSYKSSPVTRAIVATPAPSTSSPAADAGTATEPAAAPPPPGSTTTPTSAGSDRTVDGAVVPTRFGDIQVEVVLAGSKIIDVKPLQLPYDRPRSQFISQQAAPLLRQEVLDAQTANIDTLSGATYTSEAYAESLQAALDQARA